MAGANGYSPIPFPGFGRGLNLRDQPDAVPQDAAIDCLDCEFTQRGAVKQRAGYGKLTTSALTNRCDSLGVFYGSTGTRHLLAGCGTRLEALSTAGAIVASQTGLAGGPYSFARYGQPNVEAVYAGNGTNTLQKWNGAAWSAPTATVDGTAGRAMPKAGALAVWATSNRLVASGFATTTGGPNGATSSPSHVYISVAGDPENWMVTSSPALSPPTYADSVQLTPGDGESIMGVVAFQNLVFVFKESKFFVFYNEGTDNTGSPVFQFRTVDTGIGLVAKRAVCVGRDGVYFLGRSGVYKTTGGAPELVSGVLDPLFVGGLSTFYTGSQFSQTSAANARMCWHEERLYVALPTAANTNDRLLVFDPRFGWWSIYSIAASALTSFQVSSQPELVFGYAVGTNDIGRHNSGFITDDGTIISSFWKSGWFDMGSPDIKTVREIKCFGAGKVQFGYAKDFAPAPQSTITVDFTTGRDIWTDGSGTDVWTDGSGGDVWTAGPILTEKQVRNAIRGTTLSMQLRSTDLTSWTMERVTQHLRESEVPSKVSVD